MALPLSLLLAVPASRALTACAAWFLLVLHLVTGIETAGVTLTVWHNTPKRRRCEHR